MATIDRLLHADRFCGLDDPCGIWRPSADPIAALGVALRPWPGIERWVAAARLDALWLHHPWDLPLDRLGGIGVVAHHLAFDERLTIGFNPDLAAALGLRELELLGRKQGRPVGMIGNVAEQPLAMLQTALAAEFEGAATLVSGIARSASRVAVVGAMRPELIAEASRRGADVFVTGTFRIGARAAVEATGMTVIEVGHEPPERWGARRLAAALRESLPGLRVVLAPNLAPNGAGHGGS